MMYRRVVVAAFLVAQVSLLIGGLLVEGRDLPWRMFRRPSPHHFEVVLEVERASGERASMGAGEVTGFTRGATRLTFLHRHPCLWAGADEPCQRALAAWLLGRLEDPDDPVRELRVYTVITDIEAGAVRRVLRVRAP